MTNLHQRKSVDDVDERDERQSIISPNNKDTFSMRPWIGVIDLSLAVKAPRSRLALMVISAILLILVVQYASIRRALKYSIRSMTPPDEAALQLPQEGPIDALFVRPVNTSSSSASSALENQESFRATSHSASSNSNTTDTLFQAQIMRPTDALLAGPFNTSSSSSSIDASNESVRVKSQFDSSPTSKTSKNNFTIQQSTNQSKEKKNLRQSTNQSKEKKNLRQSGKQSKEKKHQKSVFSKSMKPFSTNMDWATPHLQELYRSNVTQAEPCFEQCLRSTAVSYYVYPEHMLYPDTRYHIRNLVGNNLKVDPKVTPGQHRGDALWEVVMINALMKNNSLRTNSYEDANLIIIPVPFATIYFDQWNMVNRTRILEDVRQNLQNSTPFQQGKRHVLVSTTFPLFNAHYNWVLGRDFKRLYHTLKTASVARSDDLIASQYAYLHNATPTDGFRGFDEMLSTFAPAIEYQFCVGLGEEAMHLPLVVPTWDKFQNSTFFIFYHTRRSPFFCNSTDYRRAPILNVSSEALPFSSIGYEMPLAKWKEGYADAKFCLVVRGDTPHSHALFNAVKVGCIPVVISDYYPFYAPPFPSTLDMQDFCIFLLEEDFLSNPERALQSLTDIPDDVIKSKLESLKWAQQVMIMEHPQSLFVPAFLREAMASFSRPVSVLLQGQKVQQ